MYGEYHDLQALHNPVPSRPILSYPILSFENVGFIIITASGMVVCMYVCTYYASTHLSTYLYFQYVLRT